MDESGQRGEGREGRAVGRACVVGRGERARERGDGIGMERVRRLFAQREEGLAAALVASSDPGRRVGKEGSERAVGEPSPRSRLPHARGRRDEEGERVKMNEGGRRTVVSATSSPPSSASFSAHATEEDSICSVIGRDCVSVVLAGDHALVRGGLERGGRRRGRARGAHEGGRRGARAGDVGWLRGMGGVCSFAREDVTPLARKRLREGVKVGERERSRASPEVVVRQKTPLFRAGAQIP